MTNCNTMAAAEQEAVRDRAERADPDTARMVVARDEHTAGGRFDLADATQRVIESIRMNEAGAREQDELRARSGARLERGAER